jgi:hypothetical protein
MCQIVTDALSELIPTAPQETNYVYREPQTLRVVNCTSVIAVLSDDSHSSGYVMSNDWIVSE